MGAAVGAGYAVATRRLSQGGMAAPRGSARWRVALTTGIVTASAAMGLALVGRHLVGSSLDLMADTFAGSQVGLDPLARLLGEESLRPITRTLVSGFEGLMFGSGLAFGLTRRPRSDGLMTTVNHRDTKTPRTHRDLLGSAEPKNSLCVLCVSVSLWLTSVIQRPEA